MSDDASNDAKGDLSYSEKKAPIGLFFAGAITVIAVIFVLQNLGNTETRFLFLSVTVPLAVVIVVSMLLGVVVGWLIRFVLRRRKRKKAAAD